MVNTVIARIDQFDLLSEKMPEINVDGLSSYLLIDGKRFQSLIDLEVLPGDPSEESSPFEIYQDNEL